MGALDLEQVFESVKQADTIIGEVADLRLQACKRIQLPHASARPLISNGSTDTAVRAAAESYRALRTRLMRLQGRSGSRSIVISSTRSGEGKTLTALNLGLSYAHLQDERVLVVDADLRTGGLTELLNNPSGPGLAEILGGEAQYEEAILATELPNLHVLGAGRSAVSPPELFSGDRWKEFVGWASECFTIVLIDSPPLLSLSDTELITAACDGVLLVVRARSTLREQLQESCAHIDSKKLLGLVFNATDGQDKESYYVAYGGNQKA
jgi:capsular exopolysaccharide synthesis family protein